MPGPPPPSASYNLKLSDLDSASDSDDSDSSNSSDDEIPLSQLKRRLEEKQRRQQLKLKLGADGKREESAQKAEKKADNTKERKEGAKAGGSISGSGGVGLGPKLERAASSASASSSSSASFVSVSASTTTTAATFATARDAFDTSNNADGSNDANNASGSNDNGNGEEETDEQKRRRIVEQVRLARMEQQNRHLEQCIRRAEMGQQNHNQANQSKGNKDSSNSSSKDNSKDDGGEALYLAGIERQLDEDDIDEKGNISPTKANATNVETHMMKTPTAGGKSGKNRKKRKKKKKGSGGGGSGSGSSGGSNGGNTRIGGDEVKVDTGGSSSLSALANSTKSKHSKSLSFSIVQVREYRRIMSTTTVPADGGWPLGLSDDLVRQYSAGSVEEFEHRKQIELRERYVEVYERRRARLEKKKRRDAEDGHGGGHGGIGGRSRSGSKDFGGSNGGKNRKRSGSDPGPSTAAASASACTAASSASSNNDAPLPSPRKRSHSFAVGSADVHIHPPPKDVVLETRPFDYKSSAKVLAHHKAVRRASLGVGGNNSSNDGATNNEAEITAAILDELDDGKNPLFAIRCEEERIHLILRDSKVGEEFEYPPSSPSRSKDGGDAKKKGDGSAVSSPPPSPTISRRPRSNSTSDPYHYQPPSPSRKHGSSSTSTRRTRSASNASDPHYKQNDIYTHADVMHVRSELEKLRVDRNSDLGCTCRKLHVVLPNQTPTGRKHKHRRLTERKVKEELRKRGLMHGEVLKMKREELEVLLHDTVEKEGCCSNDSCPCVHNGIGCQADTCSCWEPGHDVVDDKKKGGEEATLEELWADPPEMQSRCGNRNGLYVVDFATIGNHRRALIAAGKEISNVDGGDGLLCMPVLEPC